MPIRPVHTHVAGTGPSPTRKRIAMTTTAPLPPSPDHDATDAILRISDVTRRFGTGETAVTALGGVTLDVRPGEFVCLVGASGCGKSTLLNIIAGLDAPSTGTVDSGGHSAALMFQEGGLFPWLTARGNIELALRLAGVRNRSTRQSRAEELLAMVRLADSADRRPHELSGGMRQRVSLARALAQDAPILLMDEPFGALDAMTRDILHDEIEEVWRSTGVTIVFVTHNVREAVRLGDRVVVLASRPGRVIEEFPIMFERPRRIESHDVSTLAGTIIERLREEVRRHADD
jgi:NitT/TauT family transport system ATP-binding protein